MTDLEARFWRTFSRRLRGARKMAGLSYRELADRLHRRVSYQTLSNWENATGKALPAMDLLQSLARSLGVRYDYFFAPVREAIPYPEFRKRKSQLRKKEESAVLEQAQFALDRYLELEELTGVHSLISNPVAKIKVRDELKAELAAGTLREAWELGSNPIPQVVEMLEERSIRVLEADGPDSFDGLSAWAGPIPLMVVNRKTLDVCRRRFTLLHELGHLFLQIDDGADPRVVERFCNRFASAVLLPSKSFCEHFGAKRKHLSLAELTSLKEEWGVSIAAMVHRARDLDLLSADAYTRFCIAYKRRGYHKKEPGTYAMSEEPMRFRQLLLRAYAEEIISGTKAAYFADTSYDQFREDVEIVA